MIRKDYFLRQIAQFTQTMLYILGLLKLENYPAALEAIDQAFRELLGLGYDAAWVMSVNSLVKLFEDDEVAEIGAAKCLMAARLLHEAGKALAAQGQEEASYASHLKALDLMLIVLLQNQSSPDELLPEYAPRLEDLRESLDAYILPLETRLNLFRYAEACGQYAQAEDQLFSLVEDEPEARSTVIDLGTTFYQRLLGQPDEVLERGNLPRSEVEASLMELLGSEQMSKPIGLLINARNGE